MHIDQIYKEMIETILKDGEEKENRTGTNTIDLFGYQYRVDLREGFPILTTKKVKFDLVIKELLWFLSGSTNIKDLGCHIWDGWANSDGDCGPIYGKQFTKWDKFTSNFIIKDVPLYTNYNKEPINQIQQAIDLIKKDPNSRRIIVSAWNVADLPDMGLNPCHCLFQLNVSKEFLDLQMFQRSADNGLGTPFNIASYALLLSMFAKECKLTPRYFIHTFGSTHIYVNHIKGLKEQIKRDSFPLPKLWLNPEKTFWEYKEEDIKLENYQHGDFIKFDVAI